MLSWAAAASIVVFMLCSVRDTDSSGCSALLPTMDVLCAAHRRCKRVLEELAGANSAMPGCAKEQLIKRKSGGASGNLHGGCGPKNLASSASH